MLDMTPEELMAGPKADDMSFCVDSKEFTEKTNLGRYVNGAKSREQCELINVKMCELGRVMCLGYHWISLDAFVRPKIVGEFFGWNVGRGNVSQKLQFLLKSF